MALERREKNHKRILLHLFLDKRIKGALAKILRGRSVSVGAAVVRLTVGKLTYCTTASRQTESSVSAQHASRTADIVELI